MIKFLNVGFEDYLDNEYFLNVFSVDFRHFLQISLS